MVTRGPVKLGQGSRDCPFIGLKVEIRVSLGMWLGISVGFQRVSFEVVREVVLKWGRWLV